MGALIHFLGPRGVFPACSFEAGTITPRVGEVTCPQCRTGLPFVMADFQRAWLALARAVLRRRR